MENGLEITSILARGERPSSNFSLGYLGPTQISRLPHYERFLIARMLTRRE